MNYYFLAWKKYATFKGRASRAEYWYFVLFSFIVAVILIFIEAVVFDIGPSEDTGMLVSIYQLAVLIPSLAVFVRRMHDVDKSGWFILIPIYNFILSVIGGTKGENKYGPDPKEVK